MTPGEDTEMAPTTSAQALQQSAEDRAEAFALGKRDRTDEASTSAGTSWQGSTAHSRNLHDSAACHSMHTSRGCCSLHSQSLSRIYAFLGSASCSKTYANSWPKEPQAKPPAHNKPYALLIMQASALYLSCTHQPSTLPPHSPVSAQPSL